MTQPADTLDARRTDLAVFDDPAFADVRQIDRLDGSTPSLVIVSQHIPGVRLGDVLAIAESLALCGLLADAPMEATAPAAGHVAREGRSLGGFIQRLRGALAPVDPD